ncbi:MULTISPECIES: type II secretion system protein GspL [Stenotrophomonas]|uniref:type II secretion system protein GspL n=1 Tax=Stenotrophomonas TaxID=40323 RepID=UPI0010AB063D|nr:type II secretion system protein GspL [Stenotrophomonas maltophilia]TIE21653.1 general secretion pathway protein GspL [Stenotrophomonas maltophilia]TIE66001.1 general secretion pathway protein GspL [Stenotrophomonas maltophilia]HEL2960288.1 general secretion pathway protein GspL [Stenotrophomonas maltophilia]
MSVQLRVRLPALERLRADSAVEWAQLHKGVVLAKGRDALAVLGQRHPQAGVLACLDPQDLILLELQLPPLSGRRLQAALQGEVEAMLLDDLQEVALAHGAQAADGSVPVAWLGQQAIMQAQHLLASCGLQLQALYPTPLLLPWKEAQATLQACGEHLLVRSGRDRGFVQWCGGRDVGAVLQSLAARLQQSGVQAVQWIDSVPSAWPESLPATVVAHELQACGPLPAWSLPLPGRSRQAPRLAIGLAVAALVLAALGLQLQVSRWRSEGEALQQDMARQFSARFPEITDVVDPVLQARRALAVPLPAPPLPPVQRQVATTLQAVPELGGQVRGLRYTPGQLELELDDNARILADDAQRLEQWQQAVQAQGLQLVRDAGGRLRVSGGGQ